MVSSAVERHVYTVLVGGSIPSPPIHPSALCSGAYDPRLTGKIASAIRTLDHFFFLVFCQAAIANEAVSGFRLRKPRFENLDLDPEDRRGGPLSASAVRRSRGR